jgi:kynurenine formamidase
MEERLDAATLERWSQRYSNEGRWGADDALGTLNFISPERVRAACAIPRWGLVTSCALPFDRRAAQRSGGADPPQQPGADAPGGPGDTDAGPQGAPGAGLETQWSPRSRIFCSRRSSAAHRTERRRAATPWRDPILDGVVGRGVLLDLPRFLRHEWLDAGTRVLPLDLDNCAEALGVTVERGDIVLVRTGWLERCFREESRRDYCGEPAPGLSVHCARWLYEREVAAVASDTWSIEVTPSEIAACDRPLQEIALARTGLLVGNVFSFDVLSEACADDGEYAFLFTAPLLPAPGAEGYPVNPLAIK